MSSQNKFPDLYIFIIIFVIAMSLRVLWVCSSPSLDPITKDNPLHGDASGYHLLAQNLIKGCGLSWDCQQPTSYRMPGYPIILAAVFWGFGENLLIIRLLQAIIGALTCLPVYYIGKQLGGWKVASLASLGVAVHPLLIYMTAWIYTETIYIFLLWTGISIILLAMIKQKIMYAIVAGVVWGIGTYLRPELFIFPIFIAIWGIFAHWSLEKYKLLLASQIVLLIIILPWSIRNSINNHQLVILTTSAGSNFYAGNNPQSDGGAAWVKPLEGYSELSSDQELRKRALDWIRSDPQDSINNFFQKVVRFFSPIEFETRTNPFGKWSWVINTIYLLFLILAAWGLIKSWKLVPGVMLIAVITLYLGTALIFFGGSRVALPAVPAIFMFAAFEFIRIVRWDSPVFASMHNEK